MSKFVQTSFTSRSYAIHAIQYVACVDTLLVCGYAIQQFRRFGEVVSTEQKSELKSRIEEMNSLKSLLDSIPGDGVFAADVRQASVKIEPFLKEFEEILNDN